MVNTANLDKFPREANKLHQHPFNRALLRQRRQRYAANRPEHAAIYGEIAERLRDDLSTIKRRFERILNLHGGIEMRHAIAELYPSAKIIDFNDIPAQNAAVIGDEECLPFADHSFDLIVGNLGLHLLNDIPGALVQMRRALAPDGLFLASFLGADSFGELRQSLLEAEIDITGGAGSRMMPLPDLISSAQLMQRAEFALPVVHQDVITLSFANPMQILQTIRGLGLANFSNARTKKPLRRDVLCRMAAIYLAKYGDDNARISATMQVIYLLGWAPAANQPQALAPGSARHRLADALDSREIGAGEDTGRI